MIETVSPTDIRGAVAFPPWLSKAMVGSFLAASFTATWGGIHLGAVQIADIFLLLTFVIAAAMVVFGNLRFPIPRWLWAPAFALLACDTVLKYSPIPAGYFAFRYEPAPPTPFVPGAVLKSGFWIVALVILPIAAMACTALESRMPKRMMASFLAGVAVCSLIAVTDLTKLTRISPSLTGHAWGENRQTGLSDHPNTLGVACVIAAPFAVYLIGGSRRPWLPCIALVLLCDGVVASGSRGAEGVFPAAVLIAIFISPHTKKGMGWLAATFAAATLGSWIVLTQAAPGVLDKLLRFKGSGSSSKSDAERGILATQAWSDFKKHPIFGIGMEWITDAHNIYLQILSAGGLVLFVAMLIYWFGTLRSCWLGARNGEALGRYLMVSVIAWLVGGAMENQLTDRYLYYTVSCAAALGATYRVETLRRFRPIWAPWTSPPETTWCSSGHQEPAGRPTPASGSDSGQSNAICVTTIGTPARPP